MSVMDFLGKGSIMQREKEEGISHLTDYRCIFIHQIHQSSCDLCIKLKSYIQLPNAVFLKSTPGKAQDADLGRYLTD